MPPLVIHLLGQPRFTLGGESYKFAGRPKVLALLAYLVLRRGSAASREKVAFTLWEDDAEEDARANFRRHLHLLQQALPAAPPDKPWIVADGETVGWNPAADARIDVVEFERLASAKATRAAAIEWYGGDLLETAYDEWIFPERDRLRNR
ncbi:MAG TPA: hypothetical protein VEJ20_04685, partial [Candidatus Eremiobacteraceae bacterium]|nr:hypothetical protein [Candidatus Eremiobacteraceae bacterium]